MARRYTAVVEKQGAWYVARCPELGVVSQGKTVEEAMANVKEAIELYVESFGDDGPPEGQGGKDPFSIP